jgi:hypothetical protein
MSDKCDDPLNTSYEIEIELAACDQIRYVLQAGLHNDKEANTKKRMYMENFPS